MDNSWHSSPSKELSLRIEDGKDNSQQYSDQSEESSSWTEILAGYSDYVRRVEAGEVKEDHDDDIRGANGEGFPLGHKKVYGSSSSFDRSDSMVSDAGSGPEWKQQMMMIRNHQAGNLLLGTGSGGISLSSSSPPLNYNNTLRKLNFKNKIMNSKAEIPYDDSLEDTASSPVNSPKITFGLKRMDLNPARADQENNTSTTIFSSLIGKGVAEEATNLVNIDRMKTTPVAAAQKQNYRNKMVSSYNITAEDCTTTTPTDNNHELLKKGLCLVPVSMIPNNFIMNYSRHIG